MFKRIVRWLDNVRGWEKAEPKPTVKPAPLARDWWRHPQRYNPAWRRGQPGRPFR